MQRCTSGCFGAPFTVGFPIFFPPASPIPFGVQHVVVTGWCAAWAGVQAWMREMLARVKREQPELERKWREQDQLAEEERRKLRERDEFLRSLER
jgi:hypothetical protein